MRKNISKNLKDLLLIGGKFSDYDIPWGKKYLAKYFKKEIQIAFLKYFLMFGDYVNFVDHTGYYCHNRVIYRMKKRLELLINVYEKAKKDLTEESMELIAIIENGDYNIDVW